MTPKLNQYERGVLAFLADSADDSWFYPFQPICQDTGLNRSKVRLACRSLKCKGLAAFKAGLWDEDGRPAGAGYQATPEGRKLARELGLGGT